MSRRVRYRVEVDLLSPEGRRAIDVAASLPDPESLAAADRMRREFPADLAAAALTQVALRRRAAHKLPHAAEMFLTRDGVEQATRHAVARWRAERFVAAGVDVVWDLGCGIGADAMAMQEAGIRVRTVELEPQTATFATANLALVGGAPVVVARAEDVEVPEGDGIFLDPARRGERGRTWRTEDLSPSWALVERHLGGQYPVCVKLGPGFPKQLIPDGVEAAWVSEHGDVVELSLWNTAPEGRVAVVFPRDGTAPVEVRAPSGGVPEPPVRPIGRYVIEPDNAVIRAGLVGCLAGDDAWLLADGVAYLSSDRPGDPVLSDSFEVVEVLPYDQKVVRRWLRDHRVGTLEIKARGVDVDPAKLRRALGLKGPDSYTLILLRTPDGARAAVARRVPRM